MGFGGDPEKVASEPRQKRGRGLWYSSRMMARNARFFIYLLILAALTAGCSAPAGAAPAGAQPTLAPTIALPTQTSTPTSEPAPTLTPSPAPTDTPAFTPTPTPAVLIGAGDVAYCGDAPEYQGDDQNAALIEALLLPAAPHAVVFVAGDIVQGEGRAVEYRNCFDPTWGRFKERIRPVPGNHDYMTTGAAPYYEYFGEAAGQPGLGYYSYDVGDWHIVALNSNCNDIACGPNSDQVKWLEQDLANNPKTCTLAYWHHPRFSSGLAGGSGSVNPFWRTVVEMGVDVVVNGHDHDYERFAPMGVEGNADPNGPRLFIVGTGGGVLREFGEVKPNSEVRYSGTNGVIQFKLYPTSYEWTFYPVDDPAKTDMGTGTCH